MRFGPCMCGDLYCSSCGPAQGNWRCDICGAWSMDGGCANPKDCEEKSRIEAEAMAKVLDEDAYYEEEFRRAQEDLRMQRRVEGCDEKYL